MPRPVCVGCLAEMTPTKNGKLVHFRGGGGGDYQIFSGDEWGCKGCGARVIVGFGRDPVAEQFSPEFEKWKSATAVVVD